MSQRNSRFRSGDVAESLGTVLLQGLSLVAPVPRSEDVGLDVVATLLAYVDSYRVKATQTFYVQIKSKGTRSIEFEGEAVDWLMSLELPFFIGSVDISTSRMDLYACHTLIQAFIECRTAKTVVFHLDPKTQRGNVDKVREFYVGPPVHSWTVDEMAQSDFVKKGHEILAPHLDTFRRNLELGRCGRYERLAWETSKKPTRSGTMHVSGPNTLDRTMQLTMPYLTACLLDFNDTENMEAHAKTLALIRQMEALGAEADPIASVSWDEIDAKVRDK